MHDETENRPFDENELKMQTPNASQMNRDGGDESVSEVDRLIDAVVDDQVSEAAWTAFTQFAGNRFEYWQQLAETQRIQSTLQVGFERATMPAMSVELGSALAQHGATSVQREERDNRGVRWSPWRSASVGWAAAILLAFGWIGSAVIARPGIQNGTLSSHTPMAQSNNGSAPSASSAQVKLADYLASSNVVGELPMSEVSRTVLADGAQQVTYVRSIVERKPFRVYDVATDEAMNPVLIPAGQSAGGGKSMRF